MAAYCKSVLRNSIEQERNWQCNVNKYLTFAVSGCELRSVGVKGGPHSTVNQRLLLVFNGSETRNAAKINSSK